MHRRGWYRRGWPPTWGYGGLSRHDVGEVRLDGGGQNLGAGASPEGGVEDLDFEGAGVAGGGDGAGEAADVDAAGAGQAAAEQHALGEGGDPVGGLEGGNAAAGGFDDGPDEVVPPDVVGVDDDADRLGRVRGGEGERT